MFTAGPVLYTSNSNLKRKLCLVSPVTIHCRYAMINCDDDTYDTATTTWTDPVYDVSAGSVQGATVGVAADAASSTDREYDLGGVTALSTTTDSDDTIYELASAPNAVEDMEVLEI